MYGEAWWHWRKVKGVALKDEEGSAHCHGRGIKRWNEISGRKQNTTYPLVRVRFTEHHLEENGLLVEPGQ